MRIKLETALARIDLQRRIRICWPNPDSVCLQSGCGHCSDSNHLIAIRVVAEYAEHKGMGEDFAYGLGCNWATRTVDPL